MTSKLLYEGELFRGGLLTTMRVVEHPRDSIEFTIERFMRDEGDGHVIVDSKKKMFFTQREFRDFFEPFINEMKARFENADNSKQPERV